MNMLSGIAHAHSTYSFDGSVKLADLQTLLTDSKVDFCLMSEHVESLSYEVILNMLADYAALPTGGCLMIPGIEIDDLHILLYGVTAIHPYADIEDLAAQAVRNGSLAFVSHPIKVKGRLPQIIMPWLSGVEIWNTRYDGRRSPRQKSLDMWRELQKPLGRLQPLVGVDFHRVSDLSHVRIEVDCEKETGSILASISAGRCRLMSGDKELDLGRVTKVRSLQTHAFDSAVAANRLLKKLPFRIPRSLRRAIKRIL